MSCYVDPMQDTTPSKRWPYKQFCHLICENSPELDAIAARIGLDPRWKQNPNTPSEHYDLTAQRRLLAIGQGAIPVSVRHMGGMLWGKRFS